MAIMVRVCVGLDLVLALKGFSSANYIKLKIIVLQIFS